MLPSERPRSGAAHWCRLATSPPRARFCGSGIAYPNREGLARGGLVATVYSGADPMTMLLFVDIDQPRIQ